jgi:hypothetical protein
MAPSRNAANRRRMGEVYLHACIADCGLRIADLLVSASKLALLEGKDHLYVEVIEWLGNAREKVRLWGHRDHESFDKRFTILVPPKA